MKSDSYANAGICIGYSPKNFGIARAMEMDSMIELIIEFQCRGAMFSVDRERDKNKCYAATRSPKLNFSHGYANTLT